MPPIEVLIEKYIAYRDHCKAKQDALDAELKPYKQAMEQFEGLVSQGLGNAQSIKTDFGTAYRTSTMSAKVADRDVFFRFVMNNNVPEFLTASVSKDAVRDYMDTGKGTPPPGVDVSFVNKVLFRRA